MNTKNREELLSVISTFNDFINKKIMNEKQVSRILEKYDVYFTKKGDGYITIICQER